MSTPSRKRPDQDSDPAKAGGSPVADAPEGLGLRRLNLAAADLQRLRRQGWVHVEQRGRRQRYSLRFRGAGGQQVVRCLRGVQEAEMVREELDQLQALNRKTRELAEVTRAARDVLRATRQTLAPHLKELGYSFHGYAIRQQKPPGAGPIKEPGAALHRRRAVPL